MRYLAVAALVLARTSQAAIAKIRQAEDGSLRLNSAADQPIYLNGVDIIARMELLERLVGSTAPLSHVQTFTALDVSKDDTFGYWIAANQNSLIVSAQRGDLGTLTNTGAAYVFTRANEHDNFTQTQKLIPDDAVSSSAFGRRMAMYQDTAIVGCAGSGVESGSRPGAAYVYIRNASGHYSQTQKLLASNAKSGDALGYDVAMHGDIVVLGAPGRGGSDGASNVGAAYVFQLVAGSYVERQMLVEGDKAAADSRFGNSLAMHGDVLIIRAQIDEDTSSGVVYVYENRGTGSQASFQQQQLLRGKDSAVGDGFGISLTVQGSTIVVGAPLKNNNTGQLYVFERDPTHTTFVQTQVLIEATANVRDVLGRLSIALDGNRLLTTAPRRDTPELEGVGALIVYEKSLATGLYVQMEVVVPPAPEYDEEMGACVALAGSSVVVGSRNSDAGAQDGGAVYVYNRG
eukprot:TRINITY_DN9583_c0_g1_i1.p1 TRINITY_DN9583_c0_g1~~TRINITY_DN9583_c0_g1_i1.p1  ORF type:complete len:459 (+),score=90.32 TRINITY_DN9583_c0_g1_i1:153-1529(+)